MTNRWGKKACVWGFYCETVAFKKAVELFERMEIAEYLYEVVV